MSRKFYMVLVALAFTVLGIAASSPLAQDRRQQRLEVIDARVAEGPTLGCCKCLGGTNALDLSTTSQNRWTVNGGTAVFLTATHPAWNINPGPAQWVSSAATGGTGGLPAGDYEYRLDFVVPACTIEQRVTLTGNYGGDDNLSVFLDNAAGPASSANPNFISQCTGGWCFNTPRKTLSTFSFPVSPGPHALIIKVRNDGGPTGMFVNAKLTGACRS
jgi:hypothetical protein